MDSSYYATLSATMFFVLSSDSPKISLNKSPNSDLRKVLVMGFKLLTRMEIKICPIGINSKSIIQPRGTNRKSSTILNVCLVKNKRQFFIGSSHGVSESSHESWNLDFLGYKLCRTPHIFPFDPRYQHLFLLEFRYDLKFS
jgi:hypothetical protein